MPRLKFHTKLLLAFIVVLLPVLGLLIADFVSDLRRTQETVLDAQSMTARAIAMQAAESFDAAIDFGWAIANDPIVRSMDPSVLDAHMQALARHSPLYDSIGIYDATGLSRGWGNLHQPAEPRLRIADRPYFQAVMATNAPVISQVVELRRPKRTGMIASVPVRGPDGRPMGVVNVVMRTDLLEQRYSAARLQPGQAIFLADPQGRLAFHTDIPALTYDQSDAFLSFAPLTAALAGQSQQLDHFTSPLSEDARLGAFVPTPRYPWAVGVTTPRDVALAPLYRWLQTKLLVFTGLLMLSTAMAALLARHYARPVRQLQSMAQALGRGDMEQRVHIRTGDELEKLGASFNEMAAQVHQRQAEVNALRTEAEHQARQLAAIIASVPDAILLAHPDGRLIGANPTGLRMLGYKDTSELGQPLNHYLRRYNLRHLDGTPLTPEEVPLQRALAGETFTDMELRMRGPDGMERMVSINGAPVRDSSGHITLGEVVLHDVTEHRREEEERARLLDREQALARIGQALVSEVELERIAQVVIEQSLNALKADGIGLWLAKPEQQELTLLASHHLSPRILESLHRMPFDAPLLTARAARLETIQYAEDVRTGQVPSLTPTLARQEGFRSVVAVPLHARERLVGVMTYFTHEPRHFSLRELELHTTVSQLFAVAIEKARLFQEVKETLRLREEFMSAAAHELRTPVTTIQTWAELLLKLEEGSSRQQKGLTAITRNTRRLTRLVEHLFSAVWMAPGLPALERKPLDLQALVEERVKSLSGTTENPIQVESTGALVVDADQQRLGEAVAHLLENAIRYSPPDGPIEVKLWGTGTEAVVSVRDHGPGIPPERQPHVFEPLYEPLPPGDPGYVGVVGMGLHLSWQILEAHGGRIWLDSKPGEGTTFCFSLRLAEASGMRHAMV
jgi:PAS domain S-box-containing protein